MIAKKLRIVFMGTPEFAVESLDALVSQGYNVVGVVTVPDKPAGRGLKLKESDVKRYAVEKHLPLLQPEKLKDTEFIERLRALKADLQVVVAFRMLPEIVWAMPLMGTINLHASLLPQYRGAAPINWAIINGEDFTGVTTFLLQHEIDTGNVLYQQPVRIEETDNVGTVHDRLMVVGSEVLLKTIDDLAGNSVEPMSQETLIEKNQTGKLLPAPKLFKDDCKIDWNLNSREVYNKIRGLNPFPGAWTTLVPADGGAPLTLKIFDCKYSNISVSDKPGSIHVKKNDCQINCRDGVILLQSVQLAGKKKLDIVSFMRGFQNVESFLAV